MKFLDDYQLLVPLRPTKDAPPSLVVMDTRKVVERAPMKTVFHLSPHFANSGELSIQLEPGVHSAVLAESPAPFHQDPTQRIVVLRMESPPHHLVLQLGVLLKLLKGREGSEIGWDEWKNAVVVPCLGEECWDIWVSGCRLFSARPMDDCRDSLVKMYDFSYQGFANSLSDEAPHGVGSPELEAAFRSGVRYMLPIEARAPIPHSLPPRKVNPHICLDNFAWVSVIVLSTF